MSNHWPRLPLGEACSIVNGGTPRTSISDYWGGEILWITPKDMGKMDNEYVEDTSRKITQKGLSNSSARLMPPNSVILSTRAPIGHLAISRTEIATNQGCRGIVPSDQIEARFLFYFLKANVRLLNDLGRGAVFKELSTRSLSGVLTPLPPLPEQKRIVAILDEAFEGIATATANAEKNLANARELFESYLNSVFTEKGEGWVETTLGEATGGIFTGPFGSLLHKSDYIKNGIPLVNPAHITETGIEPDFSKTISQETARRLSKYIMREGYIVIGRRGEMGRCALITATEDGWLCGTGSFYIKPSGRCDTGYLVRFLRSDGCKAKLERIAGGAVMPNLSNTGLTSLHFDLPPLERQRVIVEEAEALHTETQRLEVIYKQKLDSLTELKQSILQKAFSGELTQRAA